MITYGLTVLFFLFFQGVYGAVLTTTIDVYFPLNHHNTLPAAQNGQLSYIGEANGVTTYLLSEPQNPSLLATFIEGKSVAVAVIPANPSFIASVSCNVVQATQALCLLANINPLNGQIATELTTDLVDSLALVEVGGPGPTPPPPLLTTSESTFMTVGPSSPPSVTNGGVVSTPQPPSTNSDITVGGSSDASLSLSSATTTSLSSLSSNLESFVSSATSTRSNQSGIIPLPTIGVPLDGGNVSPTQRIGPASGSRAADRIENINILNRLIHVLLPMFAVRVSAWLLS